MSRAPFFSVMVPTYNQARFLGPCLNSLVGQSDADWEAVVVDDGSTDDTPAVLEAWAYKDPRVRVFRQPNGGTAAALNAARARCRGDWVCWLSSDDLFEPDKLELHRRAMEHHPGARFFHTHFYHLEEASGLKTAPAHWRPMPPEGLETARFLSGNYVSGITVCIERQALLAAPPFRADLRYGQDFAMWLDLSLAHPPVFLDRRTAVTRWHSGQATNAFPVAGLYDSAWACLELLNRLSFAELFPRLDLERPEHAALAVGEVLAVCADTGSFLFQLGYSPALLLRLREWLGQPAGGAARARCRELAQGHAGRFQAGPEQLREAFAALLACGGGYRYEPLPVPEFIRSTIARPDTDGGKRRNLVGYLESKRAMGVRQ